MYAFSQGEIFVIFVIIGLCIGVLFDLFRAIRKIFRVSDFGTYVQDIIFIGLAGIFIINTLILVNNGQIRFYVIIAVLIGMLLYFFTIGRFFFLILQIFLKILKKIIGAPYLLKKILQKKKDFVE